MKYTREQWNIRHTLMLLRLNRLRDVLAVKLNELEDAYYSSDFADRGFSNRITIEKNMYDMRREYADVVYKIERYKGDTFHIIKCFLDIAWYGKIFREADARVKELEE